MRDLLKLDRPRPINKPVDIFFLNRCKLSSTRCCLLDCLIVLVEAVDELTSSCSGCRSDGINGKPRQRGWREMRFCSFALCSPEPHASKFLLYQQNIENNAFLC